MFNLGDEVYLDKDTKHTAVVVGFGEDNRGEYICVLTKKAESIKYREPNIPIFTGRNFPGIAQTIDQLK